MPQAIPNINNGTFSTSIDLLATLKKIQDVAEKRAKDSTDFDTIQNQNMIECILNVLDDGIHKLKVALIIPYFLDHPTELQNYLLNSDLEELFEYLQSYWGNNEIIFNAEKNNYLDLDYRILKAIEIIYSNKKIRENLQNYLKNISTEEKELIQIMEENRKNSARRLRISAVTEIATERLIHHIYHNNEKLKKQMAGFTARLNSREINTKWKVFSKQAVIKKYEEDLSYKKFKNRIEVKTILVRANDEMEKICTQYKQKREMLLNDLDEIKIIHKNIFARSAEEEKIFRDQKNKYVAKLQNLIEKYDTDILAKIVEHEELVAKKLEEQKKTDEFMLEYNEQEQKYQTLYNTMLEEKHRAQREKMLMFMMNRAARTIQRYWRQFVRAKKKKRGKSKGKGRAKKK